MASAVSRPRPKPRAVWQHATTSIGDHSCRRSAENEVLSPSMRHGSRSRRYILDRRLKAGPSRILRAAPIAPTPVMHTNCAWHCAATMSESVRSVIQAACWVGGGDGGSDRTAMEAPTLGRADRRTCARWKQTRNTSKKLGKTRSCSVSQWSQFNRHKLDGRIPQPNSACASRCCGPSSCRPRSCRPALGSILAYYACRYPARR